MEGDTLNVMTVASSLNKQSVTRVVILDGSDALKADGCNVDLLDLAKDHLAMVLSLIHISEPTRKAESG